MQKKHVHIYQPIKSLSLKKEEWSHIYATFFIFL
jgi:hypothetical protein